MWRNENTSCCVACRSWNCDRAAIAVVTGRHSREGEPLEAILVTKHLKFSLPYRALFARNLRPDTAERLIDALAV